MWLDKPDCDGLWWRCVGKSLQLCAVWAGKGVYQIVVDSSDDVWCLREAFNINASVCKWQRFTLTKPEPYKPPQPPRVEWFTGWRQGEFHWIAIIGDRYIATNEKGESVAGVWDGVGEYDFSTVKKRESPP